MRQNSLRHELGDGSPEADGVQDARRGAMSGRAPASRRRGFMLLELMVALTMLALVLTPLAAMIFKITSHSHRIVGASYRNAVLFDEVNYLEALSYDNLPPGTTTTIVDTWPYPHTRTVVVTEVWKRDQLKLKTVRLVVAPRSSLHRPDTVSFIRSVANTTAMFTENDQ